MVVVWRRIGTGFSEGKIKRICDPLALRAQVFVCTLFFAPCGGAEAAPGKERGMAPEAFFLLLSMFKRMASARCGVAGSAVSTLAQVLLRQSTTGT